jgi:hypothetical protein
MLTTIPFSGFYESMHSHKIVNVLEQMISDSSGRHTISDSIADKLWLHVSQPVNEYTQAFVEPFTALLNGDTGLNVKLEWESVSSPHAYNFSTDRVFATVSFQDVQALFNKVDKTVFSEVCRDSFTSYDGFWSHYSPDWKTWGSLKEWDHNQIGTILAALVKQFLHSDWEWDVIEDWNSNGDIDNWVYSNLDAEGKRLVKIADYLREREERKYR